MHRPQTDTSTMVHMITKVQLHNTSLIYQEGNSLLDIILL